MSKENEAKKRWASQHDRGFVTAEDTPPPAFVQWWKTHDHCPQLCISRDGVRGYSSGISAYKAWQCERYRVEFIERKLVDEMDMNKAIGWTQADSDALNP